MSTGVNINQLTERDGTAISNIHGNILIISIDDENKLTPKNINILTV